MLKSNHTQHATPMNLKLLPLDVIRLICSFGYPEHKQYMHQICAQLRYHLSGLLQHNLYVLKKELLKMVTHTSAKTFLKYEADRTVLHDFLQQCVRCCCCSKHCHNRPTNSFTDEVSVGENSSTECPCKCRSISRDIKRAVDEEYHPNYHRQTRFNIEFVPLSRLKKKFISNL